MNSLDQIIKIEIPDDITAIKEVALCRLCLKNTENGLHIEDKIVTLVEKLTSIKLTSEDQLSTVVCDLCLSNLKLACSIQTDIINADKKFRYDIKFTHKELDIIEHPTIKTDDNHKNEAVEETDEVLFTFSNTVNNMPEETDPLAEDVKENSKEIINISDAQTNIDNIGWDTDKDEKEVVKSKATNIVGRYECDHCDQVFPTRTKYSYHISQIKAMFDRRECTICKKMVLRTNFSHHRLAHQNIRVVCELCGQLVRIECLRVHRQSHSDVRFQCKQCEKSFKRNTSLNLHIRRDHIGVKTHMCDICGKGFFTTYRLNVHKRRTHEKLRPFQCQYCKKNFSSKNALRTHVRQHTNETPYKCETCGEGFRQNVSLRSHRKSKHNICEEVTCNCNICGRGFPSEWAMKTHQLKLH